MPIGKPILTDENDLDKIFVFVYAEVECPDDMLLRVPILPYINPVTREVNCIRGGGNLVVGILLKN